MAGRSTTLVQQFEEAMDGLIAAVGKCSDSRWSAICGDEKWTVAATAHHVGAQFPLEREYIAAAAEGAKQPELTWDDINTRNERRAGENRAIAQADVLKLLRDGKATMASYVGGLSDEQLDRTVDLRLAEGAAVSAQALIEGGVLIDHVRSHLRSIEAAG